ncbi:MAG: hypothetical protein K2X35_07015 [Bryobacteraceae bacterium]|nr:hypothetical protein [Bryobacteraceae bacterium]
MQPWRPWTLLFFAMLALLFLVANRAAYQGYFFGDDYDNLLHATRMPAPELAGHLMKPSPHQHNFRPLGALFYRAIHSAAELRFGPYVSAIFLLHMVNTVMVFLLLRTLKAEHFAAGAGTLLFAFHPAVLDVYWKPMYLYDLVCGATVILTLLLYARDRLWWLGVLTFFLAFKAKEHAVLLPLALAGYEYWSGRGRWRRLIPFFAVSALFGVQLLWLHRGRDDPYAIVLTPAAFWRGIGFYSEQLLMAPWLGLLILLAAAVFLRDPRARFGLLLFACLLFPLLLVPGRQSGAYLYVPLTGLAIAAGTSLRGRFAVPVVVVFFVVWLPWSYGHLRLYRRATLTLAAENRHYSQTLQRYIRENPDIAVFLYDGFPAGLDAFGVKAMVTHLRGESTAEPMQKYIGRLPKEAFAALIWDQAGRRLNLVPHPEGGREFPHIEIGPLTPVSQLGEGWFGLENNYRWTEPRATAVLYRPARARYFDLTVNISPEHIRRVPEIAVTVLLEGEPAGHYVFRQNGWKTVRWPLAAGAEGVARVEFRTSPAFRPDGPGGVLFGVPIGGFGFQPAN